MFCRLLVNAISFSDLNKSEWSIEDMFCLLSGVIKNEEKAIKIIADGFKIFMPVSRSKLFSKPCYSSYCYIDTVDTELQHIIEYLARIYPFHV